MMVAPLSDASDRSLIVPDLGPRLADPTFTTRLGAGYFELTSPLRGRGGALDLPESEADEIFRLWRLFTLRLLLDSEQCFLGRVARIERGPRRRARGGGVVRTVDLVARGGWLDFTHKPVKPDGDYTDEDATVTVSGFVRRMTQQVRDNSQLVQENFDQIEATGTNIGPLSVGVGDYPLSMIDHVVKAASAAGDEKYFAFYDGPGPILKARGGAPRWRHELLDTGLGDCWEVDEYASEVVASYTDANGSTQVTDSAVDDDAVDLHNGTERKRTITLDRVNADGAEAGRDAFLAEHRDPVGFTGSLTIAPRAGHLVAMMPNAEGGLEPGWRVRAGDVVDLFGELPDDPYYADGGRLRSYVIEATKYSVNTGVLEITPEARALSSRLSESPEKIGHLLRAVEPATSRKVLAHFDQAASQSVSSATATLITSFGDEGVCTFGITRSAKYNIVLGILGETSAGGEWIVGYELDGEGFDGEDNLSIRLHEDNAGINTLERTFERLLRPGSHTIRVYGIRESGAGSVALREGRLKILG